ncbi:MAG: hypothetical protein ABIX01_21770 [Chitinophagaceae bacterium]
MLPYFLLSNAGGPIAPLAESYMTVTDTQPTRLKYFSSNQFQVAVLPAPDLHYLSDGNVCMVICGFIRHPDFVWDWHGDNTPFLRRLLADLAIMDATTIKESYTGSFTILYLAGNKLQVFNTLSGLQPVYYHIINGAVTVCSSLVSMQALIKEPVRVAGALQFALNEWMETYTRATLLQNVYRLVSNEELTIHSDGNFSRSIMPFKIAYKAESTPVMDCVKSVWEGYKDIGKQFAGINLETCIALSGGVDSRTCLTSIYKHAKKVVAVNHGGEDFYEFHRAKNVADAYNIPIYMADSQGAMFPDKDRLEKYFLHDGGVVIEYDPIKDLAEVNHLPPILILGDLFETFKVDGTSVWEGRAKKKSTTLKLMFGGKIPFETVDQFGFERWVQEKADYLMRKFEKNAFLLSDEMTVQYADPKIKAEIRNDFIDWLSDFRHFGLKHVEDLNEVSYWLSKGRTSMWLQSSSSSGYSAGFTLFCTDKNLAEVLSVPLKHKLRQKLHFYMFRLPDFKAIRKIPTPQIPFTAVSAPLPVKELVMFLRLKLDHIIANKAARQDEPKKIRLLKSANYKVEYSAGNLQKISGWYHDACISQKKMKAYFTDMQTGKIGAVSTIDYVGLAKADYMCWKCDQLRQKNAKAVYAPEV